MTAQILQSTELRSVLFEGHRLDSRKFGVCRCSSSTVARMWHSVHCVLQEQSRYQTHSAYRWQQYDVIMVSRSIIKEVSKIYHQNFLLCNNNEITTCIADLFNSFCEDVYAVALFKVVQQRTR